MKKLFCIILLLLLLTVNVGQTQYYPVKMFGQMLNLGHWSTDGLVFYWRGIKAGNAVDESFFGNDGTITGATWVGEGLYFDGNGDYVTTSNAVPIGQTYTLVWRHRVDSTAGLRQILSITNPTQFYMIGGETEVRLYDGVYLISPFSDTLGEWVTYAFVGTPSSRTFYRNGIYSIGDGNATTDYTFTNSLVLGRRKSATQWWNGGISDFKIYNRALSASEIQALYIRPDLPMQQDPIWMLFSPEVGPSGIIPIIQAHARRRRAG